MSRVHEPVRKGDELSRYVIVGGGVAGTRAAETIRRQTPAAEILILSAESRPFYRRPQLTDYAAGLLSAGALSARPQSSWRERNLDLRLGTVVHAVKPEEHIVVTSGDAVLEYDRLIVATGRAPRMYAASDGVGVGLPGVISFTNFDEATELRALQGGGRAVVFGDTLPALQMVQAASALGLEVTYLAAGERILPNVLDDDASQIVANRMRAAGVQLVWTAAVAGIVQKDEKACGVRLADGKVYSADIVGACAPYEPAADFLPGGAAALRTAEDLSTPWEHVAAGDVVGDEPPSTRAPRLAPGGAGGIGGVRFSGSGFTGAVDSARAELSGDGAESRRYRPDGRPLPVGPTELRTDVMGEFYKKLVFSADDRLIGALLVGNIAEAGALEEAVKMGVGRADLDPLLLKQLFEPTYRPQYLGVQCPVCRHEIQLEPDAKAGDRVTCPICGVDFEPPGGKGHRSRQRISRTGSDQRGLRQPDGEGSCWRRKVPIAPA